MAIASRIIRRWLRHGFSTTALSTWPPTTSILAIILTREHILYSGRVKEMTRFLRQITSVQATMLRLTWSSSGSNACLWTIKSAGCSSSLSWTSVDLSQADYVKSFRVSRWESLEWSMIWWNQTQPNLRNPLTMLKKLSDATFSLKRTRRQQLKRKDWEKSDVRQKNWKQSANRLKNRRKLRSKSIQRLMEELLVCLTLLKKSSSQMERLLKTKSLALVTGSKMAKVIMPVVWLKEILALLVNY